jgi:ABC-type transporter Mla subunit MlaD
VDHEQTWWDEAEDRMQRRRRAAWSIVGTAAVVIVGVLLILIGKSLARIDSDLRTTDVAVSGLSDRAQTMPNQLERVNRSLAIAEAALRILPKDTESIAANLEQVVSALEGVQSDLSSTAPRLSHTAGDLEPAAARIGRIGENLGEASALLDRMLARSGGISKALADIEGKGNSGLAGIRAKLATISEVLRKIRGDLGDITRTGKRVNEHLEDVCNSPAVSLRRGGQRC